MKYNKAYKYGSVVFFILIDFTFVYVCMSVWISAMCVPVLPEDGRENWFALMRVIGGPEPQGVGNGTKLRASGRVAWALSCQVISLYPCGCISGCSILSYWPIYVMVTASFCFVFVLLCLFDVIWCQYRILKTYFILLFRWKCLP